MGDYFISYAGPDRPWAHWIGGLLEANGFSVEIDDWDWPPGTDAVAQMNGALERADRVLALWSPRYFDPASWAGTELSAAFYMNHVDPGRLVPVLIEAFSIPPLYKPIVHIDIAGLVEADASELLLARLRGERGGRSPFPTQVRFPRVAAPVWKVPPRNPNFTGRDRMLERLHEQLSGTDTVVIEALHGMGGVGKTQLATEYAHRFAADYDVVWWIDAEQSALIPDQFSALAESLGLANDSPDAVLAALATRDRWLLVFDNAEHPNDLKPYRPSGGRGQVVITSRYPGWGGIAGKLPVDVFAREESVLLLHRRIANLEADVADRLAEELGDLPLALEQAAGYIDAKGTAPKTYLKLFRERRDELLAEGDVADHVLLDATWSLSVEQLSQDDPAATQLLELFAFMAPEPMPTPIFTTGAGQLPEPLGPVVADELAFEQTLGRLAEYALVQRHNNAVQMHRLVQAAVRRAVAPRRDELADTAVQVLVMVCPGDILTNSDSWEAWQLLLPHVLAVTVANAQPETGAASWLIDRAARYLQTRGELQAARMLFARGLEIDERIKPDDDGDLGASLLNLGSVLNRLGESDEARAMLERAVRIAEKAFGHDSVNVATAKLTLADILASQGDIETARSTHEESIRVLEQVLGPDDRRVAAALAGLGALLLRIPDPAAAEPLLERALRIEEQTNGRDRATAAVMLVLLGRAKHALGALDDARDMLERAVVVIARGFGATDPQLLVALPMLASVHDDLGERERAAAARERAAAIEASL